MKTKESQRPEKSARSCNGMGVIFLGAPMFSMFVFRENEGQQHPVTWAWCTCALTT